MVLDYDSKDISEVSAFLVKGEKNIPFTVNDNRIILSSKDMIVVGSVKVSFKSSNYGDLEYVDNFVAGGRTLDVICKNGKIVTAVRSSGYL